MIRLAAKYRGNRYGAVFMPTWPHVSLGISAHIGGRFSHMSLHLPMGVLILGCVGATP